MVVKNKGDTRQRRKIRLVDFLGEQAAAVDMVPFADQFGELVLQGGGLFRGELFVQPYD